VLQPRIDFRPLYRRCSVYRKSPRRPVALLLSAGLLGSGAATPSAVPAHHPGDHGPVVVWPRVDVIGPLGNRLPPSYRRQMNRPTYLGGKMAHAIAPTSQEAMAWHQADHRGWYDDHGVKGLVNGKHCPPKRMTLQYFYPKPWEVLPVGPRPPAGAVDAEEAPGSTGRFVPRDEVHVEEMHDTDPAANEPFDTETLRELLGDGKDIELIPPGAPAAGRP